MIVNILIFITQAVIIWILIFRLKSNDTTINDKAKTKDISEIVVDTSVLIDGRISDLIKTGFISSNFVVPQKVIDELQLLADSRDHQKRKKARYGLDELNQLVKDYPKQFSILDRTVDIDEPYKGVDQYLVGLANKYGYKILTLDYNLNKAASVTGAEVLNINELVQALKTPAVPGDKFIVEIQHKGSSNKQGVAYLDDGTMVVVEDAQNMIGKKIDIEVEKLFRTLAGTMIFAKDITTEKKNAKKPIQTKLGNKTKPQKEKSVQRDPRRTSPKGKSKRPTRSIQ